MSLLLNVGGRFRSQFKLVDGTPFRGQMLDIPDTARVSNFLSARRYLRTPPNTIVKPTDVAVINGTKYIVGDHGDGFHVVPIYKHFKLFEVDETLEWFEATTTTDSVTGIKKVVRTTSHGNVYLSIQPHPSVSDMIGIPQVAKSAVCNKAVKPEDKIGGYLVTKVDHVLGVYFVELKQP